MKSPKFIKTETVWLEAHHSHDVDECCIKQEDEEITPNIKKKSTRFEMLVPVRQFCCDGPLKTRTIIIGVLYAVGSLLYLITCIALATVTYLATLTPQRTHGSDQGMTRVANIFLTYVSIFCIISAVTTTIEVILSIILIIGANNEDPRLMKVWMVYSKTLLIPTIGVYCIGTFIVFFISILVGLIALATLITLTIIAFQFMTVVQKFCLEIKNRTPIRI